MRITSFTSDFGKDSAKWAVFKKDIETALLSVCQKYDVDVKAGNARYSNLSTEIDLTFTTKASDGSVINLEEEEFKKYATMFGMSPNDLGVKFFYNGDIYIINGMTKTKSKYPILVRNLSQKKDFKFSASTTKSCLDKSKALGANMSDSEKMAKLSKTGMFD